MRRVFHISHTTAYTFDRMVSGLDVVARLRPPRLGAQDPVHTQIIVSSDTDGRREDDTDRLAISGPLDRLTVTAQSMVAHDPERPGPQPPPPGGSEPAAEDQAGHPLIVAWSRETLPDTAPTPDDIRRFVDRLRRDFVFDAMATTRTSSLLEFFTGCRGVCEDFARLTIACLRARGVPVRHVVGYLLPHPDQDATFGRHAHAWVSVWYPGTGWIDVDPTTGLAVPEHHVTLVRGYDRDDTLPVSGRLAHGESAGQRVAVDVSIVSA